MFNEIKHEIAELIIFFFILFVGICCCDWANKEAIHKQAVYDAQFITYDFEIPTGWEDAIIKPD